MLFSQNRDQIRRFFCDVRHKQLQHRPLEPLESLIAELIDLHPEYHALLDDPDKALDHDFQPEQGQANPFLHLGMHIAIREQLSVDRPAGIRALYQQFCRQLGDAHRTEHRIMEALGEILWEAQRAGTPPDEQRYLERLRQLTRSH